jgi:DNA-binding IclR family transcriptional regulator
METSSKEVKSAERALAVLALLARHAERALPAMTIARQLRMPKSSTYHLLNAMRRSGFVDFVSHERGWTLGEEARATSGEPSLDRVLHAVEAFDDATPRMTTDALATKVGLSLAESIRVRDLLLREGLLISEDGELRIGLRLAQLARQQPELHELRGRVRPTLIRLRDETGETANLIVLNGEHGLYVDQVESRHALRHAGWTGRQIPLTGATGAALTGSASGVAVATGAVEDGVVAIAAKIDAPASLVAAISVTGPSVRLGREEALEATARAVAEAASSLAPHSR